VALVVEIHPDNPQARLVAQVADVVRSDGLIAYPTDSSYALGCRLGCTEGLERVRRIRGLDNRHHFTLVCADFAQLGQFVRLDTSAFRAVKAATPGPYTFILPATREVPRRLAHPRKRTVGARIPDHRVTQALLRELGAPLVSSTLLLPDGEEPLTEATAIDDALGASLDAIVDAGPCSPEVTTVVDFSGAVPEVVRVGAGDPARFGG